MVSKSHGHQKFWWCDKVSSDGHRLNIQQNRPKDQLEIGLGGTCSAMRLHSFGICHDVRD